MSVARFCLEVVQTAGSPVRSIGNQPKESDHMKALKNFIVREEGQDLVEYALLAALLSIVSIAALTLLGTTISGVWDQIQAAL
jgi:pilus assembly protein Flp/PilA